MDTIAEVSESNACGPVFELTPLPSASVRLVVDTTARLRWTAARLQRLIVCFRTCALLLSDLNTHRKISARVTSFRVVKDGGVGRVRESLCQVSLTLPSGWPCLGCFQISVVVGERIWPGPKSGGRVPPRARGAPQSAP